MEIWMIPRDQYQLEAEHSQERGSRGGGLQGEANLLRRPLWLAGAFLCAEEHRRAWIREVGEIRSVRLWVLSGSEESWELNLGPLICQAAAVLLSYTQALGSYYWRPLSKGVMCSVLLFIFTSYFILFYFVVLEIKHRTLNIPGQ